MIDVLVNGKIHTIEDAMTITKFLQIISVSSQHVAIAWNDDVIDRNRYDDIILVDGDRLEIVQPVGGG